MHTANNKRAYYVESPEVTSSPNKVELSVYWISKAGISCGSNEERNGEVVS